MSKPCRPGDEHYERFLATVLAHVRDDPDYEQEIASEVDQRLDQFVTASQIFTNLGLAQHPVFRARPASVDSYQSMSIKQLFGRQSVSELWAESHPGGASEVHGKGYDAERPNKSARQVIDEADMSEPNYPNPDSLIEDNATASKELSASELDYCKANLIEPAKFLRAKLQRAGKASMKVRR